MYLISDSMPTDMVDYFEVELDGTVVRVDAERNGADSRLHYNLDGISMGNHTARVRAVNGWGVSEYTAPFDFVALLPSMPSGIGLSVD
jgi:predicted phage tail protein